MTFQPVLANTSNRVVAGRTDDAKHLQPGSVCRCGAADRLTLKASVKGESYNKTAQWRGESEKLLSLSSDAVVRVTYNDESDEDRKFW